MKSDEYWMLKAIELAKNGTGLVSPNPRVGCVVVANDIIIASGYHARYGDLHAESSALQHVPVPVPNDATLYVNLEPCAHHGKQPPCVDAILKSGIRRVVIGALDPSEHARGRSIKLMEDAGIEVVANVCAAEAERTNEWFFHNVETQTPYVVLKLAQSINGGIAPSPPSRLQMSSEASTKIVHELRAKVDAVMVGVNTVNVDNPQLNVRLVEGRNPKIIIVDNDGAIDLNSHVAQIATKENTFIVSSATSHPLSKRATIIQIHNGELKPVLKQLYAHNIGSIMCEGGPWLANSLIEQYCFQELRIIVAPVFLSTAVSATPLQHPHLSLVSTNVVGDDIHLRYKAMNR